jgi:hypothetical protein
MLKIERSFLFSLAIAFSGIASAVTEGPAPSCPVPTFGRSRTLDPARLQGKAAYVDFWAS